MDSWFAGLTPDTTIITPNRRLAAIVRTLYNQYRCTQSQCWESLDALPVINWFERLWQEYTLAHIDVQPLLLNSAQEQWLWEKLFRSKAAEHILQPDATAELLRTGYHLLKQWRIDTKHPALLEYQNGIKLSDWMLEFELLCQQSQFISSAQLPDLLAQYIKQKAIRLPKEIVLLGFTEISPQLNQFLSTCMNAGTSVNKTALGSNLGVSKRMSFIDAKEEITTMARWAKSLWEQNAKQRIGCVIPSLEKIRDQVQHIFADVFQINFSNEMDDTPFNISAGKALSHYPIIQAALKWLSLYKNAIPLETFSAILNSPFLGGSEFERARRAQFEILLRRENMHLITWHFILQENDKRSLQQLCPILTKRLKRYFACINEQPKQLTFSMWAKVFMELLTQLGWPGERSINSNEHQVVENWLKLLHDFHSLDYVSKPVSFAQALHQLEKLSATRIFQPQTPAASIQVLGVLEASGVPFDDIWIAGLNDMTWPPQPNPHPLIPKALQRELSMPHATAQRELMYCQTVIQEFKQSARNIIFSFAETEDEYEYQASPLIRDIPIIDKKNLQLAAYTSTVELIYQSQTLERLQDDRGPPVLPAQTIHGGTAILKHQALCPFKAFAEGRLHARELENTRPGLRAKDRGTITHKILELIWNQLQTHNNLLHIDDAALKQLIDACIDKSLFDLSNRRQQSKQYIKLEKQRLSKLVYEWLQLEKTRSPFTVIAQEHQSEMTFNSLKLSIRVDRIDQLLDGNKLVIDYKTGKSNELKHLFSERPEDPQLALYALLDEAQTAGIAFAQVTPGEHLFKGMSRYDLEIKGIKSFAELKNKTATTWEEQLQQWRSILTDLSERFCDGVATVDPKDHPQTCTWCALKPFCRIHEEMMTHD